MVRLLSVCFFAIFACATAQASPRYVLGALGQSCSDACYAAGLNCNEAITTDNQTKVFTALGVTCKADPTPWWASDQPSYEPTSRTCFGYINVPQGVSCQGSYPTTQRVCACNEPTKSVAPFGTGYSQGSLTNQERTMFAYHNAPGQTGVMTHFWITPSTPAVIFRYYVDGEANASIVFKPALACGVGFEDQSAPWGNKWFGKGAKTGSWFWNFRVPFQKSIRITALSDKTEVTYIILRGSPDLPINIGPITLPSTAKLVQFRTSGLFQPLQFLNLVDVPKGKGLFFMHTLSVSSNNLNFLEACYHQFSPYNQQWPGTLLSTGTEDFFDSAYYFDGGKFYLPVSGFTHLGTSPNTTFSAYRFHEEDPILFDDGYKLTWRIGDMTDKSGIKCFIISGGQTNGSPGPSYVDVYAWVYVW